jgi:hypothetical protein
LSLPPGALALVGWDLTLGSPFVKRTFFFIHIKPDILKEFLVFKVGHSFFSFLMSDTYNESLWIQTKFVGGKGEQSENLN